jgi:hypothetical protein
MKQYTTPEQTAKLIELGFAPNARIKEVQVVHSEIIVEHDCHFAIGELIEMLPREYDGEFLEILAVSLTYSKWTVRYPYGIIINKKELIDALYDMIINLKEEGVI